MGLVGAPALARHLNKSINKGTTHYKGGRKRSKTRRRGRKSRSRHPKKGQRSRTRKGRKDFVTHKGDKAYNARGHRQYRKRSPYTRRRRRR